MSWPPVPGERGMDVCLWLSVMSAASPRGWWWPAVSFLPSSDSNKETARPRWTALCFCQNEGVLGWVGGYVRLLQHIDLSILHNINPNIKISFPTYWLDYGESIWQGYTHSIGVYLLFTHPRAVRVFFSPLYVCWPHDHVFSVLVPLLLLCVLFTYFCRCSAFSFWLKMQTIKIKEHREYRY